MSEVIQLGKVCIIYSCGERHPLRPGIDAPVYWCGDILKKLQEGDDVESELTTLQTARILKRLGFDRAFRIQWFKNKKFLFGKGGKG